MGRSGGRFVRRARRNPTQGAFGHVFPHFPQPQPQPNKKKKSYLKMKTKYWNLIYEATTITCKKHENRKIWYEIAVQMGDSRRYSVGSETVTMFSSKAPEGVHFLNESEFHRIEYSPQAQWCAFTCLACIFDLAGWHFYFLMTHIQDVCRSLVIFCGLCWRISFLSYSFLHFSSLVFYWLALSLPFISSFLHFSLFIGWPCACICL